MSPLTGEFVDDPHVTERGNRGANGRRAQCQVSTRALQFFDTETTGLASGTGTRA